MKKIVRGFTFDNTSVNKLVIETFVNDLNLAFGGLYFINIVYVTLST